MVQPAEPYRWGLLLPICYRPTSNAAVSHQGGGQQDGELCLLEDERQAVWDRLERFVTSLQCTTSPGDRALMRIHVGIDQFDLEFDSDHARDRITAMFAAAGVPVTFTLLRSHFRHKLCKIWDHMAKAAVQEGADFFVLLGDDIELHTQGWKAEIEGRFTSIASTRGLPLGCACVAFRDTSFPVFPTFPVIHKVHMEVFEGSLFPPEFVNQHGDPFLFELYRRWGASEFAPIASLANTVGGRWAARYQKQGAVWQGDVLSDAIATLSEWLGPGCLAARFYCLNVVVPTYRCDVCALLRFASLRLSSSVPASLHILIVADQPGAPSLPALKALQDWAPNHLVRVYEQPCNMGASLTRNTGMAQSFGDWTVLLDDDVIPDEAILDAYLGAVLRYPKAKILVGHTRLPEPQTRMQHALVTAHVAFFFSIATRTRTPPWGVTANLLVPGRTNNSIWFSDQYPRTGGGEDVDFCIRMKNQAVPNPGPERDDVIVSVPEAAATHPFWSRPLRQAAGWARGDVLCLGALPHSTFRALPNWAEALMMLLFLLLLCGMLLPALQLAPATSLALQQWQFAQCAVAIMVCELALGLAELLPLTPSHFSLPQRLSVATLGLLPRLVQDVIRLWVKLTRLRLAHLFLHFDWMDGQSDYVATSQFSLLCRNLVWGICMASTLWWHALSSVRLLLAAAIVATILLMFTLSRSVDQIGFMKRLQLANLQPLTLPSDGVAAFVILAYQRTGSNLLCGYLHNHPEVIMHNEVFNEAKIFSYSEDMFQQPTWTWDIFSRDRDPQRFLVELLALRSPPGKPLKGQPPRAVGFKLFPEHWKAGPTGAVFRRCVADPRVKKIVLRRDNALAAYASKLRADKTGAYLKAPLDNVPLEMDPAALQGFTDHYAATYAYYDSLLAGQGQGSVLRLRYEDLEGPGVEDVVRGVFAFLGVDVAIAPHPIRETVKQTREPLMQTISNYEEVRYAFSHTQLASCF